MSDEIKARIQTLHGLFVTGIDRLAGWNKYIPNMQQTEQYLAWMDDSISRSPNGIQVTTDERLLDYLGKATQGAEVFLSIPEPSPDLFPFVSTSGSAVSSQYYNYVNEVAYRLHDDPQIAAWAGITITSGDNLILNRNRSETVHQRLIQLNPGLGDLHDQAVNATRAAQAQAQNPVEAAATQNRLLEQFKGALIARCRTTGKGTNYDRISANLAADSALTKTVVLDGQNTYNALNNELVEVRKSIKPSTGMRMEELLRLLEEHIIVITDALDPGKVGIVFFS
jgi:hypothetical protein